MDRISEFPDELFVKIFSFLPTTKDVMPTMLLSKRWQFLWMFVPKLIYDDGGYQGSEYRRFSDRSLLLHKAPFLEVLRFKVGQACGVEDIPFWTRAAEKRSVHDLIINVDTSSNASPALLPKSFYTEYIKLAELQRNHVILVDVSSPMSFPSLKFLVLGSVKYPGDEFVKRLLSSCIVLESLLVEQCPADNVTTFTVRVPSLKSLYMHKELDPDKDDDAEGFVIDAPSLESLAIHDDRGGFCVIENEMPKIVKAEVVADYLHVRKIIAFITAVKRLFVCFRESEDLQHDRCVFHCLEHLSVCTCEPESFNVLMCLLRDSPKLKYLKLDQCHPRNPNRLPSSWNKPRLVLECLLSSLETLEWVRYEGTKEEKEVAEFILRNGSCLKKVTISCKSTDSDKKLEMMEELSVLPRGSLTCHLIFDLKQPVES